jgi:hypothetical protein
VVGAAVKQRRNLGKLGKHPRPLTGVAILSCGVLRVKETATRLVDDVQQRGRIDQRGQAVEDLAEVYLERDHPRDGAAWRVDGAGRDQGDATVRLALLVSRQARVVGGESRPGMVLASGVVLAVAVGWRPGKFVGGGSAVFLLPVGVEARQIDLSGRQPDDLVKMVLEMTVLRFASDLDDVLTLMFDPHDLPATSAGSGIAQPVIIRLSYEEHVEDADQLRSRVRLVIRNGDNGSH